MKSVDNVVPLTTARDLDHLAFLPAALEIAATPPSPIGRSIALMIALIFSLALAWACWSKIDITASARGKIIPVGHIKVIQPFETGVIRAIHVTDGQKVHTGDLLIELDPKINEAERDHLRSDLVTAELDVARLDAALTDGTDPLTSFKPPRDANSNLIETQRKFLISQLVEHYAKLAALKDQQREKRAEVATADASIVKLEAVIPIQQQILNIRKVLAERGYVSKLTYLQTLQAFIEAQNDLSIQKAKMGEVRAAYAATSDALFQAQGEYRRTLFAELNEAKRKAEDFRDDLEKIAERTKLQRLRSPVSGVVQQLAVHTVGGVVTPAQQLLVVVPNQARLEIEAMLPNRDIGFVHPGQMAKIKADTFDFTRYGLLEGKVLSVSQDAVARAKPNSKGNDVSSGAAQGSSEPSGQQLNYVVTIALDKTRMQIGDRLVDLRPGMAVTVEIKTGSRSVMSYLLSPLQRYGHESLHER